MTETAPTIDPQHFRSVLGQLPTGVCVITAKDPQSGPAGMVVGSFTSVSLHPPLVAFFPDKSSTSWPKIERAGSFCANILGADHEATCRRFAAKGLNKFEGQDFRTGSTGAPMLATSLAWINCDIVSVQETGDHYFVLGSVRDMEMSDSGSALVFYQGGYGRFAALSLSAPNDHGRLTQQLRWLDMMRDELESLTTDLGAEATVTARVGDELVIVASSRATPSVEGTLVGQRIPYVPTTGAIFAAWDDPAASAAWIARTTDAASGERHRRALEVVRQRGYSLSMDSPEQHAFAQTLRRASATSDTSPPPDLDSIVQNLVYEPAELTAESRKGIRQISAPIFDAAGEVALAITLFRFGRPMPDIEAYIGRVCEGAERSTRKIGGRSQIKSA